MSQIAQLSEEEIEDRYLITGQRPVQFLLNSLAERGESFTVHFNHGSDFFTTMLLPSPSGCGKLFFDCCGNPEINRQFLNSTHNIFIGRPEGLTVQFSCGKASEIYHAGATGFSVDLPSAVLRLQRRESFRIETPRARPLQFFGRLPDSKVINLPVHNISCTGIGLHVDNLPEELGIGLALDNCRFRLPEEQSDFFVNVVVRHLSEQTGHSGRFWRVGLEFLQLNQGQENRIQNYIARVERERHELS